MKGKNQSMKSNFKVEIFKSNKKSSVNKIYTAL